MCSSGNSFILYFYLAVVHKGVIQRTESTTVERDGIAVVIKNHQSGHQKVERHKYSPVGKERIRADARTKGK